MATQNDESGVPVSVAHEMQQFRLLELPPEIVELLEAPSPALLSIKSQPSAHGTPSLKPAYAVLCTPTKSFQLRQVHTSNSLYLTQPTLEYHGNEIPAPTTCAIASCATTLELQPSDVSSARPYLEDTLPIYDIIGGEVDAEAIHKSKASIFSDIPLSDGQCEQAWGELIAFELSGSCYRPSAKTLSQVWQSINAAALAEAITLDNQFLTADLAKLVEEEGHPMSLAIAILNHLTSGVENTNGQWSCLDRTRAATFVGRTLLEAKRGQADLLTADFLDSWKDSLPESWRADAELTTIQGVYELPSSSTIRIKGATTTTTAAGASAPKTSASARKWHEKFGKNRKK